VTKLGKTEGNKEPKNTCKACIGYPSQIPLPHALHPLCLKAMYAALVRFYKEVVTSAGSKIVLVSAKVAKILRILHLHFFSKIHLADWIFSKWFHSKYLSTLDCTILIWLEASDCAQ